MYGFLDERKELNVLLIYLAFLGLAVRVTKDVVKALYEVVWVDLCAKFVEFTLWSPVLNWLSDDVEARGGAQNWLFTALVYVATKANNLYLLLRLKTFLSLTQSLLHFLQRRLQRLLTVSINVFDLRLASLILTLMTRLTFFLWVFIFIRLKLWFWSLRISLLKARAVDGHEVLRPITTIVHVAKVLLAVDLHNLPRIWTAGSRLIDENISARFLLPVAKLVRALISSFVLFRVISNEGIVVVVIVGSVFRPVVKVTARLVLRMQISLIIVQTLWLVQVLIVLKVVNVTAAFVVSHSAS